MPDLRVTTWNVLHRVHAVNWDEAAVAAFPDERDRIARITDLVRQWLASDVDVVCLQEVSGDLLTSLRASAAPGLAVIHHAYPRVPRLRLPGPSALTDAREHLVTLARLPHPRVVAEQTFATDHGKGLLAVSVGGALVIGTHVSYGPRGAAQLTSIAAVARAWTGTAVVAGDFNAEVDDVTAGLGAGFAVCDLTCEPPTRIATASSRAHTIDHVAVLRGAIAAVRVLDAEALSDHNPVSATIATG